MKKRLIILTIGTFIGLIYMLKGGILGMFSPNVEPPVLGVTNEIEDLVWRRPDGPPRVGLQVGHWKNSELPEELNRLIGNTGATGGGKAEWEVNMMIAEEAKKLLESEGIVVELLPATVPPQYWADVFIAIHADGSLDRSVSGYKIAAPRRDRTGKAPKLVELLEETYQTATGLVKDPNITRNMVGYYAFSSRRYRHAVHPMTTSAILEAGFLTNPADQKLLINNPEAAAAGLAQGIINYLRSENILKDG